MNGNSFYLFSNVLVEKGPAAYTKHAHPFGCAIISPPKCTTFDTGIDHPTPALAHRPFGPGSQRLAAPIASGLCRTYRVAGPAVSATEKGPSYPTVHPSPAAAPPVGHVALGGFHRGSTRRSSGDLCRDVPPRPASGAQQRCNGRRSLLLL